VSKTYRVNEIFLSLQGEGHRAGTVNVFVRFSGCNLSCSIEPGPRSPGGFDCDTEFTSGLDMTAEQVVAEAARLWADGTGGRLGIPWIIFTGGEPALQLDAALLLAARSGNVGFRCAVETNGSIALPKGTDWISVSPKVAEHAIRQRDAEEVRYVRSRGQAIPKTIVRAVHYFISPAWGPRGIEPEDMAHCVQLVKENPTWKLSCQQHKWWGVR
jgi:7-carboxy-7-deazaguanine synthase